MLAIPQKNRNDLISTLEKNGIPRKKRGPYLKWARYFLDFCNKYCCDASSGQSLPPFIKKLREKRQTPDQQKQASHAVSLFLGTTIGSRRNSCKLEKGGPSLSPQSGLNTSKGFQKNLANVVQEGAFGRFAQTSAKTGAAQSKEKVEATFKSNDFHEQDRNYRGFGANLLPMEQYGKTVFRLPNCNPGKEEIGVKP